jgi:hypothetical protein
MKKSNFICAVLAATIGVVNLQSCKDDDPSVAIHDIATAEKVSVDRFSATAGHLMVRTPMNGLPAANASVNFDQGPFITKGKGPTGQNVEYYNFDVQPTIPAPIYVLFKEGARDPVDGQFNIIDVLPGETGYNDFWQVHKVTVPQGYKANQVASYAEIQSAKYMIEPMSAIVNCPVVPDGSAATKRLAGGSAALTKGWYKGKAVSYFNFTEKSLTTSGGDVPLSTIYVTFNINPDLMGGGPPSGFVTENGSTQTHNVVATLPSDAGYSPLWAVDAYDNASFTTVSNLNTAVGATSKGMHLANVNCPIVTIQ